MSKGLRCLKRAHPNLLNAPLTTWDGLTQEELADDLSYVKWKIVTADRDAVPLELEHRVFVRRQQFMGEKCNYLVVTTACGTRNLLTWRIPKDALEEARLALRQSTVDDSLQNLYEKAARLDVTKMRELGFDEQLCKDVERGERYDLQECPAPFYRGNYGS